MPPTAARAIAPVSRRRQRPAQLDRAARGAAAAPRRRRATCVQALRPPTQANAADLAYPGRQRRRLGAADHGRRARRAAAQRRAAVLHRRRSGALIPNLVRGYPGAAGERRRFPRALLVRAGGFSGRLHDGRLRPLRRRAAERRLQLERPATPTTCAPGRSRRRPRAADLVQLRRGLQRHDRGPRRQVASAAERAPQRRRGRLAARCSTSAPPHAPGEGLGRAVAAQVDAAAHRRPPAARAGDLEPRRDLRAGLDLAG